MSGQDPAFSAMAAAFESLEQSRADEQQRRIAWRDLSAQDAKIIALLRWLLAEARWECDRARAALAGQLGSPEERP